jgi:acyl-CoA reductase-like NAD-dependent aldehyde dehydrogenase
VNTQIELNATETHIKTSMNFESRNPATGELLGTHPEHNKAEIEVRLKRAWDGWRHWSRTPLHERIAFLTRLAELLEMRAETYGRPPPRRRGGGLSQATARPRRTGADHL